MPILTFPALKVIATGGTSQFGEVAHASTLVPELQTLDGRSKST